VNAKVKILESLLGRVQHNAQALRRVTAGGQVSPAPFPTEVAVRPPASAAPILRGALELDEPGSVTGGSMSPDSFDEFSSSSGSLSASFGAPPVPREPFPLDSVSLDSEPPAPLLPPGPKPTLEQLGQTVPLEEGPVVELEVDRAQARAAADSAPPSVRGLEAAIPSRPSATAFDLPAPPEAREELERYRLGQTQQVVVDAYARPSISTNVIDFVTAQREFQPTTFAELLESSLKL
jgi:hypothetical protein